MNFAANNVLSSALNFLRVSQKVGAQKLERLSSGRRINKASDDPSGLGIVNNLRRVSHGLKTANQDIQDGMSFLQLRDSAMGEVQDILLRIRDLSVRAANDAVLTTADREKLADEAGALVSQINMINTSTTFNKLKVFMPNFETVPGGWAGDIDHTGIVEFSLDLAANTIAGVVTIDATWFDGWADFPDINLISPDGTEAFGYLYDTWQSPQTVESYIGGVGAQTATNGDPANNAGIDLVPPGAVMDSAAQITYTGWGGLPDEEVFTVTNPAPGMWTLVIDNEDAAPHQYGIFINEPPVWPVEVDRLRVGPFGDDALYASRIQIFEVDSVALKLSVNFATGDAARDSIDSVDSAIEYVSQKRQGDGSHFNILNHILNDNNQQIINMESARSRIEDADIASEITEFTRNQIVAQSNIGAAAHSMDSLSALRMLIEAAMG